MTAKVISITFYIVAGFFAYTVSLIGFAVTPSTMIKLGIMGGFSVPVLIALFVGFACNGFRHKLRDTGIVLLASSGFEAFSVFTFWCILATPDFRKMMTPATIAQLSDYPVGFGFLFITFVCGLIALRQGLKAPNQLTDPTSPSVTPPAGAGGAPSVDADH